MVSTILSSVGSLRMRFVQWLRLSLRDPTYCCIPTRSSAAFKFLVQTSAHQVAANKQPLVGNETGRLQPKGVYANWSLRSAPPRVARRRSGKAGQAQFLESLDVSKQAISFQIRFRQNGRKKYFIYFLSNIIFVDFTNLSISIELG